jgi:hypothetical protein
VSADRPPTVNCPGCGEDVEIEHRPMRTFAGIVGYAAEETEHSALLRHMDECPAQVEAR